MRQLPKPITPAVGDVFVLANEVLSRLFSIG
jgi:hypothetical protein